MKKIVLTGGGTGGHVTPHLALLPLLKKKYEIYYIGTSGIEKEIMQKFPFVKFFEVDSAKFVRKLTLKNFYIPFKLLKANNQSKKIMKEIKPNVVFSKGGYVSVPVVLAAKSLGIPVISHESDLSMGLANKIIYKNCKVMCTSFKETCTGKKKCMFTGPPIIEELFKGDPQKGYQISCLTKTKPCIMIVGGSTGAQTLNNIIHASLSALTQKYNIIHIIGKGKENKAIKNASYFQIGFSSEIQHLLAISDVVISRAGSNAIFEFLSLQKPMLLIPLPKGVSRGDQVQNAENFKNNGFARVLNQEKLTFETLQKELELLFKEIKQKIKTMKNYKMEDSNKKIFEIIKSNSI